MVIILKYRYFKRKTHSHFKPAPTKVFSYCTSLAFRLQNSTSRLVNLPKAKNDLIGIKEFASLASFLFSQGAKKLRPTNALTLSYRQIVRTYLWWSLFTAVADSKQSFFFQPLFNLLGKIISSRKSSQILTFLSSIYKTILHNFERLFWISNPDEESCLFSL